MTAHPSRQVHDWLCSSWDGDTLGGGANAPRYYDHIADTVGARAIVVSNGDTSQTIEVVDNEGLFNTYADRIRAKVAADGYNINNIQISSTHDESAPDTIGLGGAEGVISGTNEYFANYLVQKSALAIERGRYVLPDGKLSRNPLGTTDTIKCTAPVETTFATDGPAVAVWEPESGVIQPAQWMDLFGRPQSTPDRNTRGYIDSNGHRHWLDVFADIAGQPQTVEP